MSEPKEFEVIRRFREHDDRGKFDDIRVTYRISGGMPAEGRADEELRVSGSDFTASARDRSGPGSPREASTTLKHDELKNLL